MCVTETQSKQEGGRYSSRFVQYEGVVAAFTNEYCPEEMIYGWVTAWLHRPDTWQRTLR